MSSRRTYTSSSLVIDTTTSTAGSVAGDSSNEAIPELFAARGLTCTVDFGTTDADMACTTITGIEWMTGATRRMVQVVGREVSADDEDALLDQVRATITNIVDGVSFDVVAHAPDGTSGVYLVHIVGV